MKVITLLVAFTGIAGCAASFTSDKIDILSSNRNSVMIRGDGPQRVLDVADKECAKHGRSARVAKHIIGTRIERDEWYFDCY